MVVFEKQRRADTPSVATATAATARDARVRRISR